MELGKGVLSFFLLHHCITTEYYQSVENSGLIKLAIFVCPEFENRMSLGVLCPQGPMCLVSWRALFSTGSGLASAFQSSNSRHAFFCAPDCVSLGL